MNRIIAESITKEYRLNAKGRKKQALKNISFSVVQGETVGLIGRNGSGKSTLLKIISSITAPTSGRVTVNGRVSALLELGCGFHPEYTGIENIFLTGTINGLSRKETEKLIPEIIDFADIGDYINQPVKTYSDGMFLRLGFAVAVCSLPDILIIDEALAVGDFAFQAKCFKKIEDMKNQGVTVLFVTHDHDTVRKMCRRAIWLENGEIRMDDDVEKVTSAYMQAMVGGEAAINQGNMINRFGSHPNSIVSVDYPKYWRWNSDVCITVLVDVPHNAQPEGLDLSVSVRNREGLDLLVFSASERGIKLEKGKRQRIRFRFKNLFTGGKYTLSAALERRDRFPIQYYDYCEGIGTVEAETKSDCFGLFHTGVEVEACEKEETEY